MRSTALSSRLVALGLGLLVTQTDGLAQSQPAESAVISTLSPAEVVDASVAAFNVDDFEALYDLMDPNVVLFMTELDSLIVNIEGREAFREQTENRRSWLGTGDARIEVLDRIVSEYLVIQRERLTIQPQGGDPRSSTSVKTYRVREGKIIRRWDLPQEVMDSSQIPQIESPAFAPGAGPTVWIDAAHNTMHNSEGTYWAFGEMLRQDGFRVRTWTHAFTDSLPAAGDVLVISNALADRNVGDWSLPTPSAFTELEVDRISAWVTDGGRLLLIADHMPFPGAAADLGATFGFEFSNGFAIDTAALGQTQAYGPWSGWAEFTFRRSDGSLVAHSILQGRSAATRVDSVRTFTGQAFRSPTAAAALLIVPSTTISLVPDTAWEFSEANRVIDVNAWHQGAALEFGEGRVVVLGEAAHFRPLDGTNLLGDNGRFARNVVEWLAGVID